MRWILPLAGALFLACAPPQSPDDGATPVPSAFPTPTHIVDLTHAFGPDTIYWPTDTSGFVLEQLADGVTEQGYYYAANRFAAAEHGGTHLDAPVHFAAGGLTAAQIPLERLVAPGVVVDVSEQASASPDYQIGVADLERFESEHGRLPDGHIVLLRTGYAAFWPDRARYLGTESTGPEAIPELHFPGLDPEAAEWLVTERSIAAIGIDTASIDFGQSTAFGSHVALFAAGIPAFENVAALDQLPPTGFLVTALPMKIAGGSGGPLRIVALW